MRKRAFSLVLRDGTLPVNEVTVFSVCGVPLHPLQDVLLSFFGKGDFFVMKKERFPVHALVICALLCAISILVGKLPMLEVSNVLRFTLENFPIILAGYAFGPLAGALTGAVVDLLGCLIKGFAINPVITLGAACVGLCAGLVRLAFCGRHTWYTLLLAVFASHIVGNIIIKTAGLYWWYEALRPTLIFRLPTYLITAAAEYGILFALLKVKPFQKYLQKEQQRGETKS